MQTSRSPSGPALPPIFGPLVRLVLWMGDRLGAVVGLSAHLGRASTEIGGAVLLGGGVATMVGLGLHPLLAVGAGIGLAVLFVVMHSWIVVREQQAE